MFDLWNTLTNNIKLGMIETIKQNLESMFLDLNSKVEEVGGLLTKSPSTFDRAVFDFVKNINETAIIPLVALIVTAIFCMKTIDLVLKKNRMEEIGTSDIFKLIVETSIYTFVLTRSFDFVMAIFDVSSNIVNRTIGVINNTSVLSLNDIENISNVLQDKSIPYLMGLAVETSFAKLVMLVFSVIIILVVYSRIFEIYIYVSVSSLTFATLGHNEWDHIGKNYIKHLIALGLQSLFIVICIGIYQTRIRTLDFASNDIHANLLMSLVYGTLLSFVIFKSGSYAKAVVSAG